MPKKEKDVDPQIEKIFTTADHHISDPDDPINVGRASNEASKTNPEGEHMEIDDYSFSVGMELKRETRAGMNIKVGRNEVFRPAETVKIWSNVNFDKRKITFEEAFRGLAEKLLNEMEKLPFADVDSVIEEAKEISASTSPPPQPVQRERSTPRRSSTSRRDSQRTSGRKGWSAWIPWENRPIVDLSEWFPRSPFKESETRPGFYHCGERDMDEQEAKDIFDGKIDGAWYSEPRGQFQGRYWYRRE
jgi:hypothetical protein